MDNMSQAKKLTEQTCVNQIIFVLLAGDSRLSLYVMFNNDDDIIIIFFLISNGKKIAARSHQHD